MKVGDKYKETYNDVLVIYELTKISGSRIYFDTHSDNLKEIDGQENWHCPKTALKKDLEQKLVVKITDEEYQKCLEVIEMKLLALQ